MCKVKLYREGNNYNVSILINIWMKIAYSIVNKFHIFVFAERIVVGVMRSLTLEGMHHLIYLAQPTLTE